MLQAFEAETTPRHLLLVRITHWTFTLGFFGLVVSGFAIILAHPHFYRGETGNILTPPLFNLPLPTMLGGDLRTGHFTVEAKITLVLHCPHSGFPIC